jgi:hypothetical protein
MEALDLKNVLFLLQQNGLGLMACYTFFNFTNQ